ncbi:DinB family protein [Paenibacillus sediminis]|uniref:Damage-inducible protein DinB n=1 Tax=Paenibacillus sediminis TaxID=664909 RepID=A0ABS4H5Q4_9BACL|nr:DinB family protein [Paenibacillus sediminis]MBP1937420.1 putative damage-inducible protein DinB [Paenibacillus sediminis]
MGKLELLLRKWDQCYDQEDWYPPLADAIKGITKEQAQWRPQGEASNTIWETVNHLLYYKERFLKRLKNEEQEEHLGNDDTFAAASNGMGWQEAGARLKAVHMEIRELLAGLNDDDVDRPLPNVTIAEQAASLIAHDAYHTGQIILIRKLQGSWPARRSYE